MLFLAYSIQRIKILEGVYNRGSLSKDLQKIAVVVIFRNEIENIPRIVEELQKQSIDSNLYEIYLYDDSSTDGSCEMAEKIATQSENIFLVRIPDMVGSRKKWAINDVFKRTSCNYFLLTDADCYVSPNWISSFAGTLHRRPNLVGGIVLREGKGIRGMWENIESLILAGVTALGLSRGWPIMVNGGNLMVSSEVLRSKPFEGKGLVASGDDMNLMEAAVKLGRRAVFFNNQLESVVLTKEVNSFSRFFHQKIRWAGKWRISGIGSMEIMVIAFALFQLIYLLGISFALIDGVSNPFFWNLFLFKSFSEVFLCVSISDKFRFPFSKNGLIIFEVLFPLYFLLFGSFSRFLSFEWKGRRISDHG